eukprot:6208001-Pleurochrysis_carterae.AAC.2
MRTGATARARACIPRVRAFRACVHSARARLPRVRAFRACAPSARARITRVRALRACAHYARARGRSARARVCACAHAHARVRVRARVCAASRARLDGERRVGPRVGGKVADAQQEPHQRAGCHRPRRLRHEPLGNVILRHLAAAPAKAPARLAFKESKQIGAYVPCCAARSLNSRAAFLFASILPASCSAVTTLPRCWRHRTGRRRVLAAGAAPRRSPPANE